VNLCGFFQYGRVFSLLIALVYCHELISEAFSVGNFEVSHCEIEFFVDDAPNTPPTRINHHILILRDASSPLQYRIAILSDNFGPDQSITRICDHHLCV
jgi:hypothetical protein